MPSVRIIVTGVKEVDDRLAALEPKVQKQVARKASRAVAKNVMQEAKVLVPKRTGQAARSLKVRAIKRTRTAVGAMVVGGSDDQSGGTAYHLKFLELGWNDRKPGRFLRGTLYDQTTRWRREFERELLRLINQIPNRPPKLR